VTDVAQNVGTIGPLLPGAPQQPVAQPQAAWGPQPVPMLEGVDISSHVSVGVYGGEGTAKTIFAASAPKPLFLDTENSTTSLRDWPELLQNCKIARRLTWKDHSDIILKRLRDPNDPWADRETVVLDTLDAWQNSNLQAILDGGPTDKFLPMEHHYKKSGEMLRRWLTELRDMDRFHLVVLVHEKEVFIGEGMGAQRFVRPAVTPKVMSVLWNDFDIVGHMRTFMEQPTDPFANGLQVRSDQVIKAKCRLRHLAAQIPNPHFNTILEAFNKSKEGFQQ
jgi:hypothetical protein